MGGTLTALGVEGGNETDPITLQPSRLISQQTHMGVADDAIQEVPSLLPLPNNSCWTD